MLSAKRWTFCSNLYELIHLTYVLDNIWFMSQLIQNGDWSSSVAHFTYSWDIIQARIHKYSPLP